MIKAVIFDMDGLMIDSEPLQSKSFEKVLRDYGHEPQYNEDGVIQIVGLKAKDIWEMLKKKHSINEEIDVLLAKKQKAYIKILKKNIKPMPGLLKLLELLQNKKIKLAVASSSSAEHIELVLTKLGIKHYFDSIISGETLEKGKPHPQIYTNSAKELNLNPEECVALEDAQPGVESASSAGTKVIAVPNVATKSQDFSKADLIVDSLEDINWDIISKL